MGLSNLVYELQSRFGNKVLSMDELSNERKELETRLKIPQEYL